MTASEGTSSASRRSGASITWANIPGLSRRPGLGIAARTVIVRLASCALGRMAMMRPANRSPGKAVSVALTGCPTRALPASASGTAASSQIGLYPLISASDWPAATVMPGLTPSDVIAPDCGAVTVMIVCGRPLRATEAIIESGMPSSRRRSRAARVNASSPVAATARYSFCAPPHSGTRMSTIGAPLAIRSCGAWP